LPAGDLISLHVLPLPAPACLACPHCLVALRSSFSRSICMSSRSLPLRCSSMDYLSLCLLLSFSHLWILCLSFLQCITLSAFLPYLSSLYSPSLYLSQVVSGDNIPSSLYHNRSCWTNLLYMPPVQLCHLPACVPIHSGVCKLADLFVVNMADISLPSSVLTTILPLPCPSHSVPSSFLFYVSFCPVLTCGSCGSHC